MSSMTSPTRAAAAIRSHPGRARAATLLAGAGALVGLALTGRLGAAGALAVVLAAAVALMGLDRLRLVHQVSSLELYDPLTGLANRRLLLDRAGQAFGHALRHGSEVAAIVIDLDGFELVNDRLGRGAGDRLLCVAAERIRLATRSMDTVARTGGDEFIVLAGVLSAAEAMILAERLGAELGHPVQGDGFEQKLGTSIGVATTGPTRASVEELIRDAELATQAVKGGGGGGVLLFSESLRSHAREQLLAREDLEAALANEDFWLLCQPQFDLRYGCIYGVEAIARWNNRGRGLVPVEVLAALAEETGLSVALGRWVMREAFAQASRWPKVARGTRSVAVAINIPDVQLRAPSLVEDVRAALAASGLSPERVILEISERALVRRDQIMLDTLGSLKSLGVRIAIEDVGGGFVSLASLKELPLDILKIGPSVVRAGEDGERGRALLDALVSIGNQLDVVTLAEGVERRSQLDGIEEAGFDVVQGTLLGSPLTSEEIARLIENDDVMTPRAAPVPARRAA